MKPEPINDLLNKPRTVAVILFLLGAFFVWVAFYFDGTGDVGDSIDHYFFARYAFQHPFNFLNSWAKPVFVACAAPFAQFGFSGIKVFNILISLATAWLLFLSLRKMECRLAWLSTIFIFSAPLYFILMFSGLTEYLFAFFLVAGIYLCVSRHFWAAAFLLSFLPFVRSEGLLILFPVALYLLVKGKWKTIPALITGHLVFGVLGLIFMGDFLWMFTENAYSSYSNEYGIGEWYHFITQLNYVIGVPLYFIFGIGLLLILAGVFIKRFRFKSFLSERYILIWLSFMVFFIAHTIFWKFGLFHSMGLKRVLICVVPLIIFIIIDVFEMSIIFLNKFQLKWILLIVFVGIILVFPFTANRAAVNIKKDIELQNDQMQMIALVEKLKIQFPDKQNMMIYCSHPYIQLLLDVDPFDHSKTNRVGFYNQKTKMADSYLIIWDCSFALNEDGVLLESLTKDKSLTLLNGFSENSKKDCFFVFVKNE